MNIDRLTPPNEVLRELGRRLARIRKQQGYVQEQLALEAGIGVATLRRIEGGQDGQLESWVKLLQALQLPESINNLLPENFDSPMAEALAKKKRRTRKTSADSDTVWGDEAS